MEASRTKLEGVRLIRPDVFDDHRGEYVEIYSEERYREQGIDIRFVEDDISVSSRFVLRGIHADTEAWKLISCLLGRIYLVIVDCRKDKDSFGKWQSFTLTERNRHQVLVPPNFGVVHLALTEKIIFHYKQSMGYDPERQSTYKWDHPEFGIWWPVKNPILSRRDEEGRYV